MQILKEHTSEEYLLKQIAGQALKMRRVETTWAILELLPELRPHYFWPLLINAYKTDGEAGN